MKKVKNRFGIFFKSLILGFGLLLFHSCVPNVKDTTRTRNISASLVGKTNVGLYQGLVLADNPIILSKNTSLGSDFDLNRLLSVGNITSNSFLKGNSSCFGLTYCFEVKANKESPSALQSASGKWVYNAKSIEFLEVNTFYHLNKIFNSFIADLTSGYSRAYSGVTAQYETPLPLSVQTSTSVFNITDTMLTAYADCDDANNSSFNPANISLCFGYTDGLANVKWAQDSTIIYHEAGHFFQKLQLNLRNPVSGVRVDLGRGNLYDEAGSIGEGLSDYYSYYVNDRPHFAEWAVGRFLKASRPMSESDPLHTAGISTDTDQRLSYPQYLNYNPNDVNLPVDDIHYAGMIISHYLVALTEDLKTKCVMNQAEAKSLVVHLITETLSELGDLTSNGTNSVLTNDKVNLNSTYSSDWFKTINPINYRSFIQTFAKNLKNNLYTLPRCNGIAYSKDYIESLIDQYGLLLFRTYNEHRNLADPLVLAYNNTNVTATNRKKSVLIPKSLLILDPTTNASAAFIIDDQAQIKAAVKAMQTSLIILPDYLSGQTDTDFGFNNGNGKMSPGEVVGVALNLYNNSNSTMGGVQILANNWDHADASGVPCLFPSTLSTDLWPSIAEGGVACNSITAAAATDFAPVCFMQYNGSNSTTWISQEKFRENIALNSNFCLDSSDTKDCFIRAIKGADQAIYSKINPKSTWGQTLANLETGEAPSLDAGNVVFFEVSKHIPPGTVVDCRFRIRFTNCDDCYHDSTRSNYDFKDVDYNGPLPYKIIHLQIPIID